MKLAKIASALNARLENGSPGTEITGVAGIEEAGSGQLTFVANPKYAAAAKTTKASAVIVAEDFPAIPARARTFLSAAEVRARRAPDRSDPYFRQDR